MRADVPEERKRVVQGESGVQFPLRHACAGINGPDELQGPNEMWRETKQSPPLVARLEDQVQIAVLQVSQAAVDEPRRPARRSAGKVVFLHQGDLESAQRGVPSDAATGDSTADHEEIE